MKTKTTMVVWLAAAGVLFAAGTAHAIPAFARKYETSCQTCHTIYPKLTPFGEAFRRNGFRFPGNDGDFIKQEQQPLGQEAYRKVFPNAVWPGTLPASVPLALGFNGTAVFHPDTASGAAQGDNGSVFSLHDLVAEAHLWAGGSFSPRVTFFGEVTLSGNGVDIEHAELHVGDIMGPKHAVNLYVGRGAPNITSFGAHSSYVADAPMPGLSLTALYNAGGFDSFNILGQYNLIELNGTIKGRVAYAVGANSGANLDVRTTENVYGHLGFKLGGMRLDGEGDTTGNPTKPWAENALTVDLFGYRSASRFTHAAYTAADGTTMVPAGGQDDLTYLGGGSLRAQLGSLELNSGFYHEWHDHPLANGTAATAWAQFNELSYVVWPWLVPAVRVEYLSLHPDGAKRIGDLRIIPGVAMLIRPNIKLSVIGQIEWANGAPDNGWGNAGGYAVLPPVGNITELEQISVYMAYAF